MTITELIKNIFKKTIAEVDAEKAERLSQEEIIDDSIADAVNALADEVTARIIQGADLQDKIDSVNSRIDTLEHDMLEGDTAIITDEELDEYFPPITNEELDEIFPEIEE